MASSQLCVRKPQALSPQSQPEQNPLNFRFRNTCSRAQLLLNPFSWQNINLLTWRHHPYVSIPLLCQRTLIGRARGANLTLFAALVINMTQEISPELGTDTQLPVTWAVPLPLGRGWVGYLQHTHVPIWQVQLYTTINQRPFNSARMSQDCCNQIPEWTKSCCSST